MKIECSGLTDVGRKRDHNEDTYIADAELGLYVVCDGMGGHAAGEVASKIAADTVRDELHAHRAIIDGYRKAPSTERQEEVQALVRRSIENACAAVYDEAQADPNKAGMGTTLELVLVVHNVGFMGHVGDSRLYMKRGDEVHQLSEDHSFVNEMVRAGHMTVEDARQSPYSNVVTRAVGIQRTVKADTLAFDILPGDTLLICSDGLSDYIESPSDLRNLLGNDDLGTTSKRLIDTANERGGKDNITALVLRGVSDRTASPPSGVQDVQEKLAVLKRVRLFKHLTFKELVTLLSITEVETHNPEVQLITEGERESDFFVVLDGQVQVTRQGVVLAELKQGDHVGDMELITNRARSATVTTLSKVAVLVIRRPDFIGLMKAHEHLAVKLLWSFLQTLSVRLALTNEQLSQVSEHDTEDESWPFGS